MRGLVPYTMSCLSVGPRFGAREREAVEIALRGLFRSPEKFSRLRMRLIAKMFTTTKSGVRHALAARQRLARGEVA